MLLYFLYIKFKEDNYFEKEKHPNKKVKVTVKDPQKDITLKTLKRIEKQSGVKFNWFPWDLFYHQLQKEVFMYKDNQS